MPIDFDGNDRGYSDMSSSIATESQDQSSFVPLYPQFNGPTHWFVKGPKCTIRGKETKALTISLLELCFSELHTAASIAA